MIALVQSEAVLFLSNSLSVSLSLPCNVYIVPCTPIINDRAHESEKRKTKKDKEKEQAQNITVIFIL